MKELNSSSMMAKMFWMLCFIMVLQQLEHQVVTHPSTSKYNKIKEKYDELSKEHKYTKVSTMARQKYDNVLLRSGVLKDNLDV